MAQIQFKRSNVAQYQSPDGRVVIDKVEVFRRASKRMGRAWAVTVDGTQSKERHDNIRDAKAEGESLLYKADFGDCPMHSVPVITTLPKDGRVYVHIYRIGSDVEVGVYGTKKQADIMHEDVYEISECNKVIEVDLNG